eukprot:TRINITY_DN3106_c0_g1_i1.p1 TRINITY_DN3106_c0_g1~~TRINITY_DN3106_c0_g1_i1.p1  ORF type:complete len:516 (-),score=126.91 TRINITY_DN3106_c0_g1_i1:781-2328(-)
MVRATIFGAVTAAVCFDRSLALNRLPVDPHELPVETVALAEHAAPTASVAAAANGKSQADVQKKSNLLAELAKQAKAPGACAPLSETGYRQVVEVHSQPQMALFIRRVIARHGGSVACEDCLNGVVPWYSGEKSAQSYDALEQELSVATWVNGFLLDADLARAGPKALAAMTKLDDNGYLMVAELAGADAMEIFVRRILGARGARIVDQGAMLRTVPNYKKVLTTKSLKNLLLNLRRESWVSGLPPLNMPPAKLHADAMKALAALQLSQKSFSSAALSRSEPDAKKAAAHSVHSGLILLSSAHQRSIHLEVPAEHSNEFSDASYEELLARRNNGETGAYIRGLLAACGAKVADMDAFKKFVPEFSGRRGTRTFAQLLDALQHAAFVVPVSNNLTKLHAEVESPQDALHASVLRASTSASSDDAVDAADAERSMQQQEMQARIDAEESAATHGGGANGHWSKEEATTQLMHVDDEVVPVSLLSSQEVYVTCESLHLGMLVVAHDCLLQKGAGRVPR